MTFGDPMTMLRGTLRERVSGLLEINKKDLGRVKDAEREAYQDAHEAWREAAMAMSKGESPVPHAARAEEALMKLISFYRGRIWMVNDLLTEALEGKDEEEQGS